MRRKGFTLPEQVLVVAIVMILVAVAVPSLDRYVARVRLQLAGMTMEQDLRQMQAEAVTENSYHTIVFFTDENGYYFREGTKSWRRRMPSGGGAAELKRGVSTGGLQAAAGLRRLRYPVFHGLLDCHDELQ